VPALKSVTIPQTDSSIITVTDINSPSFTATLAGSGILRASGTAMRLNVTIGVPATWSSTNWSPAMY
jgi:hypothetical protein